MARDHLSYVNIHKDSSAIIEVSNRCLSARMPTLLKTGAGYLIRHPDINPGPVGEV
jgi:hypothetical protein